MAENLLSEKTVRAAKPCPKPYKMGDGKGMYLLVQPDGSKLWRLKFRLDGKERLLALGVYDDVGLALARERRDDARKLVARGVDPVAHKHAQRDAKHSNSMLSPHTLNVAQVFRRRARLDIHSTPQR